MLQQAAHISEKLRLTRESVLLDVCCGNGAFTTMLASHCKEVTGVDLSPKLIGHANAQKKDNEQFFVADALRLNEWPLYTQYAGRFDAVTLCFSFQYFETVEKGLSVIEQMLPLLKSGGQILLTDVPDRARFFRHYHSLSRIAGLVIQMAKGNNVMGKFWSEEELAFICKQLNVRGEKLVQAKQYPYAHYRMDYLVTKP